MKALLSTLLLFLALLTAQGAAIGTWNTFLAYSDITEIEPAGKMVYVLSSKGLFSYNTKDQSVDTYDKNNVLNDVSIEHIAYCKAAHRLVIVYENQNIDLLDDQGNVVNISDYYNKSMTAEKTVYEVKIIGTDAYLSTGFGILRVNVADAEISATYNLGKKVSSAIVYNNEVYAATNDGILKASTTTNLLDKSNWTQESALVIDHLYNLDSLWPSTMAPSTSKNVTTGRNSTTGTIISVISPEGNSSWGNTAISGCSTHHEASKSSLTTTTMPRLSPTTPPTTATGATNPTTNSIHSCLTAPPLCLNSPTYSPTGPNTTILGSCVTPTTSSTAAAEDGTLSLNYSARPPLKSTKTRHGPFVRTISNKR